VGWRRDHTERLIGWVAGHGVDDQQIVHGRGDRHRRVTELAQDGEFQVAVAFALSTAPPIARDRDGAADNGVEPRIDQMLKGEFWCLPVARVKCGGRRETAASAFALDTDAGEIKRRLSGLSWRPYTAEEAKDPTIAVIGGRDREAFPEFYGEYDARVLANARPAGRAIVTGAITYTGTAELQRDIANLKAGLAKVKGVTGFLPVLPKTSIGSPEPLQLRLCSE